MHTINETPPEIVDAAPSPHYHAVVWMDHHEARIIHFNLEESDETVIKPSDAPRHVHIKSGTAAGTHVTAEPVFYHDIAKALASVQAILLIGPSFAKTEFMTFLQKHAPQTAGHVTAVEPSDKVTDPQLLAEGRRFFRSQDRTTLQTP